MDDNNKPKSKLPANALGLTLGSIGVLFFGWLLFYTIIFWFVGLILMIIGIIMPVAGIVTAIWALCLGKERIGKSGIITSIIAIVVPVILITVIIILFSTGVAYIRFM